MSKRIARQHSASFDLLAFSQVDLCVCAFCFLQQAIFAVISVAPDGIRLSEDILARAIVSFYTSQKLVPAGISQEAQRIGRRKWALACGSARQSSGGCGLRHRTMPRPKL